MNTVRVLLSENEREIISLLTLSLSDIKECELEVCLDPGELIERLEQRQPVLVLLNAASDPNQTLQLLERIRQIENGSYVIVSSPEKASRTSDEWMKAGAHDCIVKDRNYVTNIVSAVKKALIRIAEREAFEVPILSRAQHLILDENLPDIIFSLDLDGEILYANQAIFTLLGYRQNEIVGKVFADLIGLEDQKQKFKSYLQDMDRRISFRELLVLSRRNGQRHTFDINFTLMEGEIIYGVARQQSEVDDMAPFPEVEQPAESLQPAFSGDGIPARLGAYQIVTLLGAGAMGRVYKGFDDQLERYVAIKVISRSLAANETYLERFKREAKILASISHPNIALIYFFGSLEGVPYFCMEYLANGSIESLLNEHKRIDYETAITYVIQAASGLREALSKGVLHMDIKPSNLMLAEDGRLKIVDFGLAHTKRHMSDLEDTIVGTPLYIAPEQIIGGVADFRMDMYSLGITFFQMLYGFPPFKGQTVPDIFHAKLKGNIPLNTELNPDVPSRLYDLACRMLARDPLQRVSSYQELIDELEAIRRSVGNLENLPEIEQPEPSVVKMRGLIYDHPVPELLGRIVHEQMTGKLIISWGKLLKQLHFEQGNLTALLSNQEGEDFIDVLISKLPAEAKMMRKLQSGRSFDLFQGYSTAIERVSTDLRQSLSQDLRSHVEKVLENLFPWMVGEFIFEEGNFPRQLDLSLDIQQIVSRGVREWLDSETIRRRLFEGLCVVRHDPEFVRHLRVLDLQPSDRFLLFRFETEISYGSLYQLSAIPEEEFARLLYLFHCFGLVDFVPVEKNPSPPSRSPEPKPSAAIPIVAQSPNFQSPPKHQVDQCTYYTHCAVKSFEEKNYWASVEYCRKALEHRQDANVYRLMGRALATHPRFQRDALDAYQKALALSPENIGIERDIADLYFQRGSLEIAKRKYEDILTKNPSDPHALRRLQEILKMKR